MTIQMCDAKKAINDLILLSFSPNKDFEIDNMNFIATIEFFTKRHLKIPIFKIYCMIGNFIAPFTNKRIQPDRISKILVIQGGGIGDLIRIFPLIRALKERFSDASLSVLSPFGHELFELFLHPEIISKNLILDLAGKHKSFMSKLSLVRSLRKKSFDLIICPQIGLGMIEFAILSFLIGAPFRVGYTMLGCGCLHTTKVELVEDKSIYKQHGKLLTTSDICRPFDDYYLKEPYLNISEKNNHFAQSFIKKYGVTDDDLIFTISPVVLADRKNRSPQHPRPLSESRSWSEKKYVDLICQIISTYKAKVIVLGDSIPIGTFSEFLLDTNEPSLISAVGHTTIGQSAALINISDIFISNDSGLLHVAIALKKPCVGIFGSTSPQQVIPAVDYCFPVWKGLECSPCLIHQPVPDFKCPHELACLKSITVKDVMEAVESLLVN